MFSDVGSTEREKEAATYMLFLDLLYECQEQVHEGKYKTFMYIHVLKLLHCYVQVSVFKAYFLFFSRGKAVPPMDFETQPSLYFSSSLFLPTASTCALSLTLPTRYYNDPITFKKKMIFAIMNHGGFGLH